MQSEDTNNTRILNPKSQNDSEDISPWGLIRRVKTLTRRIKISRGSQPLRAALRVDLHSSQDCTKQSALSQDLIALVVFDVVALPEGDEFGVYARVDTDAALLAVFHTKDASTAFARYMAQTTANYGTHPDGSFIPPVPFV